jgi:polyamine oxidase
LTEKLDSLSDEIDVSEGDISIRQALTEVGWNVPNSGVSAAVEFVDIVWDNAGPVETASYERNYEFETTEEDFGYNELLISDKRGLDSVITYLKNEIDLSNVKLGQKVSEINRSEEMVTVVTNKGSYTAKNVIVTASIGVLKSGLISFDPPLPDWKLEALNASRMTSYVKVFAAWNQKWWKDTDFAPSTMDGMTWVVMMDGDGESNNQWKIMGPLVSKTPIIMFSAVDEEGKRVESLTEQEVKTEIAEKLRRAYPNRTVPEPDYLKKTDWGKNELF